MEILIESGSLSWPATLADTETGRKIAENLPLEGRARRWGQEIYFSIPIHIELEEGASAQVSKGDLAYWPTGQAFCIFFGKTPASRGDDIRAASPVNVFGSVKGDLKSLDQVEDGDLVLVREAD